MIYHVLPETEPFSELAGGALSRWAANTLRHDNARIVCPWADATWGFDNQRIRAQLAMNAYGRILKQREYRVRIAYRVRVMHLIMKSLAHGLGRADALYIHNRPEYVLALPRREKRAFKVVLHMHNDHLANLSPAEKTLLDPDLAVFNSRFLATQGSALIANLPRTAVLHNGADEECFYPASRISNGPPVVLFVGRLIPEKGVHVLVAAMRALQASGVSAVARIIGSPSFNDDRSSQYAEVLRAGAPDNVQFRPFVAGKALAEEFRRAAIFCCPSTWDEPFGMVNVEAMASGLPVVATRSGGIPEIFSDGGALLVAKDSVRELAGALQRLLLDVALRKQLAREGFAGYWKRFRWSVIASEYRNLMDGLFALPASRIVPFSGMDIEPIATRRA